MPLTEEEKEKILLKSFTDHPSIFQTALVMWCIIGYFFFRFIYYLIIDPAYRKEVKEYLAEEIPKIPEKIGRAFDDWMDEQRKGLQVMLVLPYMISCGVPIIPHG